MEAARHHGGLRHVPAVRPRHLPQPCHQPDSVIRVRSIPDYRLRRLRETALSPVVQPAEPVPAAIGDPADSGHPAGDLRDLHTARLIRQALFAVTIGKRRGHWFDLLWDKASTQSILSPEHASQSHRFHGKQTILK